VGGRVVAGLTFIELGDTCVQCMEFMALCVWGLFNNVDAQWVAVWLLASHILGWVEYNLYYMLNSIIDIC